MGTIRRNSNIKLVRREVGSASLSPELAPTTAVVETESPLILVPNQDFLFGAEDFVDGGVHRSMDPRAFTLLSDAFVRFAGDAERMIGQYDGTVWNGGSFRIGLLGADPELEYCFEYNAGRMGGASSFALQASRIGEAGGESALVLGFNRHYDDNNPGSNGINTIQLSGDFRHQQKPAGRSLGKMLKGFTEKQNAVEPDDPRIAGMNLLIAAVIQGSGYQVLDRGKRWEPESALQHFIFSGVR